MSDALGRALAGATVVTPNRRLARHLADVHDRAQLAAGLRAWPAAHVLPWTAWIAAMESEAVAAGALPALARLPSHASVQLWRASIAADGTPLLDDAALAASAAEAWEHVHAWGTGAESWRAWAGGDDEPAAFARWAERYRGALAAHGATDASTAADRVVRAAPAMPAWRGRHVAFAGFVAMTPQARRVAEALVRAGANVDDVSTVGAPLAPVRRAEFASSDDELVAALGWARREVERRPASTVGIVVPDLAQRLAGVRARASDLLGVPPEGAGGVRSWNVSLGEPLDATPIVGAAVDVLALAWSTLPAGRAAALLRSAFLPGAGGGARESRARIERVWLERGLHRVRLVDAISALQRSEDALAERLASVHTVASRTRRATRHGWVDAWREGLRASGWPGERPLASPEHQAAGAFDGLLVAFAALDATAAARAEIAGDEALALLAELAAATPYQPEAPPAPIQILGLIEAIGLPFDALWVAGMSDAAWPRSPRPHPLLPVRWQRERGVPRSDAAGELAWAREVVAWFRRAAPVVITSHAANGDDGPATRSALFADAETIAIDVPATAARRMFDARPARVRLVDPVAPAPAPGERHRKGSGLIEAQSACPFQAVAAARWRADAWPAAAIGLTPMERGILVHAALAAFWRETRDHAALVALAADPGPYADARERAARAAMAEIDDARWRRVPAAVRALEAGRLARLLGAWLDAVELPRSPFAVVHVEHEERLVLGALELELRLDRLDELADGGAAIVDYKTGKVSSPARWIADRPEATQLALYTLARRADHPFAGVRAVVLGQVRPGDCKAVGVYADAAARWGAPPMRNPGAGIVDWPAHEARWGALMHGLADEFVRGHAAVAPRDAAACRSCARQALCRVGEVSVPEDEEEDE
ncbi:MAG: PD-(D/E)XK nuclease family protein [Burkholderiales bacterium]|nr:PD-(D/E)XK nuclease family protein [Burkholderiales bacterium]